MTTSKPSNRSAIALVGPPGVGKSRLGAAVAAKLALSLGCLDDEADIVVVPWSDLDGRSSMARLRKRATVLGLWRHPTRILEASGYRCVPTRRNKTQGGFGRTGTATREFRRLDRGCDKILMLGELADDEAVDALAEAIEELRAPPSADSSPAQRQGFDGWAEYWVTGIDADPAAAARLADAMARFVEHLLGEGISRRTISGICSDLNAAGWIVFSYYAPDVDRCLGHFSYPPDEFTFRRKFSESPHAGRRYRASLEAFAEFLVASGLIADDD